MAKDSVQFSGGVFGLSGKDRPSCLIGRRVTPRPWITSPMTWKRSSRKYYWSASSTVMTAFPMSGVVRIGANFIGGGLPVAADSIQYTAEVTPAGVGIRSEIHP